MIPRSPREAGPDLATYDRIVVAFSGGKDSLASVLRLFEMGASPARMELWHHLVDGREGSTLMDWPVTTAYCKAFAAHFGIPIYFTWKEGGFEREMNRSDALTAPIHFEAPQPDGTVKVLTTGGKGGKRATRRQFPQVAADLSVRWCSAYLKIDNARTALRNQDRFNHSFTLFVSGERAEESPGRAKYAVFGPDDADARHSARLRRHIDRYRPVHGWTEAEVWAIIERWKINPHPAYRLGWGRCSCAGCIFGSASQFATLRALDPARFRRLRGYEVAFGRTMKRDVGLDELADRGTLYDVDPEAARAALSETFDEPVVLDTWTLPAGAFGESAGPT